jgi:hypothetical protein
MAKDLRLPGKNRSPRMPAQAHLTAEKTDPAFPARDSRAPVQILRSTREWLDQITDELSLRSYDEAIMFLIAERQRHLPW